jgi:hypothetical protein
MHQVITVITASPCGLYLTPVMMLAPLCERTGSQVALNDIYILWSWFTVAAVRPFGKLVMQSAVMTEGRWKADMS